MSDTNRMQVLKAVGLVTLMVSSAAMAIGQTTPHRARTAAATQASLAQTRQKLEQQQAQVKQLQDNVAKQESDSRQASERMKKQDQAITEMQKELQALSAKPVAGHR